MNSCLESLFRKVCRAYIFLQIIKIAKMKVLAIVALFAFVGYSNAQCGGSPTVISRSGWGARPPTGSTAMSNPVPYVVIHHSASAACTTQSACSASVRSFQNLHMDSNGWADIGYSYLVGGDGNAYEGRGWSKVGAHAPGFNTNSIGICLIGNWMTSLPPANQISAAKQLITCGINGGKISSGYWLKGHRQAVATACPGDRLYTDIKTWGRWQA